MVSCSGQYSCPQKRYITLLSLVPPTETRLQLCLLNSNSSTKNCLILSSKNLIPRMDNSSTSPPTADDPLVVYARALHRYTLRLWAETRRIAEEKDRALKISESPPISAKAEEVMDTTKEMSSSQPDQSSDNQT